METLKRFWVESIKRIENKTYIVGRTLKGPIYVGDQFTQIMRQEADLSDKLDIKTWFVLESKVQPLIIKSILLPSGMNSSDIFEGSTGGLEIDNDSIANLNIVNKVLATEPEVHE